MELIKKINRTQVRFFLPTRFFRTVLSPLLHSIDLDPGPAALIGRSAHGRPSLRWLLQLVLLVMKYYNLEVLASKGAGWRNINLRRPEVQKKKAL